ncbi:MAG: hypothetical protein TREMPRED_005389, partial [Tremellales sp. Tagirdzhanova-0007]
QLEALCVGEFIGRQHSGLDDATNISRILVALVDRDVLIESNAHLPHLNNSNRYPWMAAPGVVMWEDWMSLSRKSGMGDLGSRTTPGEAPPTEWVLVEDAGGRMRAVTRLVAHEEEPKGEELVAAGSAVAPLPIPLTSHPSTMTSNDDNTSPPTETPL